MSPRETSEMRKTIKLTLVKLGFRCDLIGFTYLSYAVELAILNPNLIHNLCKNLYTVIAKKYQTENNNTVERSIRHSIDIKLEEGAFTIFNKIFNSHIFAPDEKPTVGQLIKLLLEYFQLGLYKDFLKKDIVD